MKKINLLLILFSLSIAVKAQLYIQPYAGYMLSSHPQIKQSFITINNYQTVETLKLKYGQGMNAGIVLGYDFKNSLSLELNANAQLFSSFTTSAAEPNLSGLNSSSYSYSFYGYFGSVTYATNIYQIAPQLVYRVLKNKFKVNFKIGPNLLVAKITHKYHTVDRDTEESDLNPYLIQVYEKVEYDTRNLSVGLRSSIGVDYQISSSLFASVNLVSVYSNPNFTNGTVKRYELDGVTHPNPSSSTGENRINLSQVGLTLGVKYAFQKK